MEWNFAVKNFVIFCRLYTKLFHKSILNTLIDKILIFLPGVEICVLHLIDEEEFAETWMAYSITHLNGDVPTVETLAQMERKELSSNTKMSANSSNSRQATTPLIVYNKTPSSTKKYPFYVSTFLIYVLCRKCFDCLIVTRKSTVGADIMNPRV